MLEPVVLEPVVLEPVVLESVADGASVDGPGVVVSDVTDIVDEVGELTLETVGSVCPEPLTADVHAATRPAHASVAVSMTMYRRRRFSQKLLGGR